MSKAEAVFHAYEQRLQNSTPGASLKKQTSNEDLPQPHRPGVADGPIKQQPANIRNRTTR